jgi:hypothetical protein
VIKNGNPSIIIEHLYRARHYKKRLLFLVMDNLYRMIYKVEYDFKVAGYIDHYKTIEIIKDNFF